MKGRRNLNEGVEGIVQVLYLTIYTAEGIEGFGRFERVRGFEGVKGFEVVEGFGGFEGFVGADGTDMAAIYLLPNSQNTLES